MQTTNIINKVERFITNRQLLKPSDKVLVAVSGGADSVAMLMILKALRFDVMALHCNFHLRGEESDRDEAFVTNLCKQHNIELVIKHFDTKAYAESHAISIEMAARDLRYEWFEEQLKSKSAQAIAVAHHIDDQAETLLLNLIRGTGIRGLCGMHPKSGNIVRPLLCLSKQEILEFLEASGQTYVFDSTNAERDARRNVIRLDVMPLLKTLNPNIEFTLAETAEHMQDTLPHYETGILNLSSQIVNKQGDKFDTSRYIAAGRPKAVLHEWLSGNGFSAKDEAQIEEHIDEEPGAIYVSDTHQLLRDRDVLILRAKTKPTATEYDLNEHDSATLDGGMTITASIHDVTEKLPRSKDYAWLDYDNIEFPLRIRKAQTGDRFIPYGMTGSKLLSDFLTDCKLNRFEKQEQWVVTSRNEIAWVVGLRSDSRFCITEKTRKVVLLHSSASSTSQD